jgi:hypothetical protein
MGWHRSLLLNLLVVLGLSLSSVLVISPIVAETGRALVAAPVASTEEAGEIVLASKRAKVTHDRRQDRSKDAQQNRKKDRTRKDRKPRSSHGQVAIGDLDKECRSLESIVQQQIELCTHGPDPPPPGLAITRAVPLLSEEEAAERVTAAAIGCDGDGVSGNRTEVLYVRASDIPDHYAASLPTIQNVLAETDRIFRTNSAATGPVRSLRFVQDPATCQPVVRDVVLSAAGDDDFHATVNEVWNKGYNRSTRIYLMFVDTTAAGICGAGSIWPDDQPLANNRNNTGPAHSRVDRGCWRGDVAAHELMHNLGGVQDSAPHSSKGGHCTDEYDIMCYSDAPYFPSMTIACPDPALNATRLDCHYDDYFHSNPAAGSYLATHWNPANNQFLLGTRPSPPAANAAPPPTTKHKKHEKHKKHGKHKRR